MGLSASATWAGASLRSGTVTTAGFTDEVLRYESPVQFTIREALTDGQVVECAPSRPVPG